MRLVSRIIKPRQKASRRPRYKSKNKAPVITVTSNKNGNSCFRSTGGVSIGTIRIVNPSTIPILNRLEPRVLPIARSGCWLSAATADENISGADVPKATIVKPIMRGEMPKILAIDDAPTTNLSPPQIRPANPIKTNMILKNINAVSLSRDDNFC